MKKAFILLSLLPMMAFGQLKVASNGNVGIQTSETPLSPLSVGCSGESNVFSKILGEGLTLSLSGSTISGQTYDIFYLPPPPEFPDSEGSSLLLSKSKTSLLSSSSIFPTYPNGMGLSSVIDCNSSDFGIGVRSVVSGNSYSQGVGVAGTVVSPSSGAGVFGSSSFELFNEIDGLYAGFFYGDVKVTGTINGTVISSSDERLKKNVQDLGSTSDSGSALDKLGMLTPVSYNYIDPAEERRASESPSQITVNGKTYTYEERPNPVMEKTHFGLMAQELQKVYPDLVYEQDNGYLAINYTELIPVLLQSIKELNEKVESLSGGALTRAAMGNSSDNNALEEELQGTPAMSQNVPNPFSTSTDIAVYLPETVSSAWLHIYDLQGKQLEKHEVTGRGNTTMTIRADKMEDGMYIYALVADGKVITSKKMIVSK